MRLPATTAIGSRLATRSHLSGQGERDAGWWRVTTAGETQPYLYGIVPVAASKYV